MFKIIYPNFIFCLFFLSYFFAPLNFADEYAHKNTHSNQELNLINKEFKKELKKTHKHKNKKGKKNKPKPLDLKKNEKDTAKLLPQLILKNPPYDPGMFSVFCSIISTLQIYDSAPHQYNGINILLDSGRYYDEKVGPNWWEYFFEPLSISKSNYFKNQIISYHDLMNAGWWPIFNVDRQRDADIIQKYIRVNKHIENKIDNYLKDNFSNKFMIGIHFRGTDKISEARRVPYEEVRDSIYAAIQKIPPQKKDNYALFVATDEDDFLKYIKNHFSCPIYYTKSLRSTNGQPTHFSYYHNNNYQKGEDAVMDCLLLSKVDYLIRTVSNLSFISERFNPNIPVDILQ